MGTGGGFHGTGTFSFMKYALSSLFQELPHSQDGLPATGLVNWSGVSKNYWSGVSKNYWSRVSKNYWSGVSKNYWSGVSKNYWSGVGKNYWSGVGKNIGKELARTIGQELARTWEGAFRACFWPLTIALACNH